MEKTLQVLNSLERNGVLGRYAIGGAVGKAVHFIDKSQATSMVQKGDWL